jgi:hypothetical protein
MTHDVTSPLPNTALRKDYSITSSANRKHAWRHLDTEQEATSQMRRNRYHPESRALDQCER